MDARFYAKSKTEVIKELDTSAHTGLYIDEVANRLAEYGPNAIQMGKKINPFKIFIHQFTDFLIIILIIAALVSYLVGFLPGQKPGLENTILILVIVFFNGLFGFFQDYKAEKNIEALKKISVDKAKVIREGTVHLVKSEELVPGDIVIMGAGDKAPADIRLLDSNGLCIDESILTGESVPSPKQTRALDKRMPLADRSNMAYMNTIITQGEGLGVIVATGESTEVGKIATQILEAPPKTTPFTKELNQLGKRIGYIILGLILIISLVQIFIGKISPITIFMVAVSLGVAAIPEGLPAVVTLSMAIGTRKMLKRNALVRKLAVVESLGSVNVICTDKTGTLTENRMTVRKVYFNGEFYELKGVGYSTKGEFLRNGKPIDPKILQSILNAGLNCNDAVFGTDDKGRKTYIGDPTEVALVVSAKKAGLTTQYKHIDEVPFSSKTKVMITAHKIHGKHIAFIKGAPEMVLKRCPKLMHNHPIKLDKAGLREILAANHEMASKALRVLGFGYKVLGERFTKKDLENGFVFLGLQGMIDPPREGVKESISACHTAGIIVKMVTGDNLHTAKAIATEIGLGSIAINGEELDNMTDAELRKKVENIDIFARVSPEHKVRVLKALQDNGYLVAMTGDGVNDAPALKNSDVGVGMGVRGSDLAKECSEMVLLDDNFVTITRAIEEGRTIFNNIRKFVNYLLTTNIAEVLVVFIVSLFGSITNGALALLPVQLLWINLLTDGISAMALGVDPPLPDTMKKKPVPKGEGVINKHIMLQILIMGLVLAAITLPLFFIGFKKSAAMAQTMVFTGLVMYEFLRVSVIRSQEHLGFFSNKWLVLAILAAIGLQLVVVYTPLGKLFGVVTLGAFEWLMIIALGIVGYIVSLKLTKVLAKRYE